jgi:hypothetical protein
VDNVVDVGMEGWIVWVVWGAVGEPRGGGVDSVGAVGEPRGGGVDSVGGVGAAGEPNKQMDGGGQ